MAFVMLAMICSLDPYEFLSLSPVSLLVACWWDLSMRLSREFDSLKDVIVRFEVKFIETVHI
jgi:hypothetical protein